MSNLVTSSALLSRDCSVKKGLCSQPSTNYQ